MNEATTWDPLSLLEPQLFLPEQASTFSTSDLDGSFNLLWAVFIDGVQTFLAGCSTGDRDDRAFREAERWIFRSDSEVLTSFSSLCGVFNIDVRCLRRKLFEIREESKSFGRTGPGARAA